jgi:hypothetical protein
MSTAISEKNRLGPGQPKIAPIKPSANFIYNNTSNPVYTTTRLETDRLNPVFIKTTSTNQGLKALVAIFALIIIGGGIAIGVLYDQGYIRFGKNEKWTY